MNWLDQITENLTRKVAQKSSRRSFIGGVGTAIIGGATIPLLPVARAAGGNEQPAAPTDADSVMVTNPVRIDPMTIPIKATGGNTPRIIIPTICLALMVVAARFSGGTAAGMARL